MKKLIFLFFFSQLCLCQITVVQAGVQLKTVKFTPLANKLK